MATEQLGYFGSPTHESRGSKRPCKAFFFEVHKRKKGQSQGVRGRDFKSVQDIGADDGSEWR